MPTEPPDTKLNIKTASGDFYRGFTKNVTIIAKLLIGALLIWAIGFPEHSGTFLGKINGFLLANFNFWYIYVTAFYIVLCLAAAIIPATRN
ncbi:hypothetical protein ACQU0X_20870 [Pseudovibrio ascidiaceicola]|uniref:hypothetical protein n=1 Tax=Pseudovibrio ascidiaceicola TaxID=285279 RepID=UPI003D363C10